jgi:RNA polymerase primary sigma factor
MGEKYESNDTNDSAEDDSDLTDLLSIEDSIDSAEHTTTIRPDVVEKAFATLSADAQRCDGELLRDDVNRTYLRKQLSIAECVMLEEKIAAAGYRVLEDDIEPNLEIEGAADPKKMYRYLNEAEEKSLGRRIQLQLGLPEDTSKLDPVYVNRVRKDAERAKATFVASNLRYVEKLARRMGQHRHLSLEDVMQEGFIGLLKATDLYDPERGFRFKTYATWWIEQRMQRAIADGDRTIRLPVHIQEKITKIRRAKAKLTLTRGYVPTMDELAVAVGMEKDALITLDWRVQATDCVEGDMLIGEDSTLLSLVADPTESVFEVILYKQLQERFRDILATLTPREAHIVRMRFGIDLDCDHTLESIGQQYNLTRERIRQIEAKAFKKLRHSTRSDRLNDFLDS